jgi:glutathione S-transferase
MASILLEELKAVYKDFEYEAISIDFSKNEQKEDWFLKINPKSVHVYLLGPHRLKTKRYQWKNSSHGRSE